MVGEDSFYLYPLSSAAPQTSVGPVVKHDNYYVSSDFPFKIRPTGDRISKFDPEPLVHYAKTLDAGAITGMSAYLRL